MHRLTYVVLIALMFATLAVASVLAINTMDRRIAGRRLIDYSCTTSPVILDDGKLGDATVCTGNGGFWGGSKGGGVGMGPGDPLGDGGHSHINGKLHQ